MSARQRPMNLRLSQIDAGQAREFVLCAGDRASTAARDWSGRPGQADLGPGGEPLRLHFAPGRWLLPHVDVPMQSRLEAAVQAGAGVLFDVEGKWAAWLLEGADAGRALAGSVDIDAVLADRGCAAVALFDCPAIVMRSGNGYRLWVGASYAQAFADAIRRLAGG